MRLLSYPRSRIRRRALHKHPPNRIDRRSPLRPNNLVQPVNHRAIQITPQLIVTVCRQRQSSLRRHLRQTRIRIPNLRNARLGRQIQAVPQLQYSSHDKWLSDIPAPLDPGLFRKRHRPKRIRLPEIDPRPQPIVSIPALPKGLTPQQSFTNRPVASVIAENKAGRESMQSSLPVRLRQLPRLRVNPRIHQCLQRRFLGYSSRRSIRRSRQPEPLHRILHRHFLRPPHSRRLRLHTPTLPPQKQVP